MNRTRITRIRRMVADNLWGWACVFARKITENLNQGKIMLNTKLIIFDGITGSGKSTASHYVSRQLARNNIKAKWFQEQVDNNPLQLNVNDWEKKTDESDADHSKRIMEKNYEIWTNFYNTIKEDNSVYIIESFLFQEILFFHFAYDLDKQTIKNYSHKVLEIIKSLNPVLIHFYQNDVDKSLRLNWQRRGEKWTNWLIQSCEDTQYCKKRNLSGEKGVVQLWQDFSDFSLELFNEYDFRKLQIENSKQDWPKYRKQLIDFLEVEQIEENAFEPSFEEYCGFYCGFNVHVRENRLCIDASWPNLKLIPIAEDEFDWEGFPLTIKFLRDNQNKVKSFKFTKALYLQYIENSKFKKIEEVKLSLNELNCFCGEFYNQSKNLKRKIYVKDDQLFYYREEGDETELIPLSSQQLTMSRINGILTFGFKDGAKQFILSVKGNEDLVFVEQPSCPSQ